MPPRAPTTPEVRVDEIARFDNWDAREASVSNAGEWRTTVTDFIETNQGRCRIPKIIHQIWIGTREPPCVWLDSWRVDYQLNHGLSAGWKYNLWDNTAVANMRAQQELINGDLYEREAMWQCKADLLRLELLYRYGGVYIDADLISLDKPLDDVLALAEETGFGVSYEADTSDKPYSVLGNSIIFASKGHPLLALLIQYIRVIYDQKRPHFGVEWVTGPLAFTKALMHSNMPLTMIPRHLFYPAFHYVPNPDAINPNDFPDSIGFQFGYTCSNLGEWVKHNNRCKKALDCTHCATKKNYPLGSIVPFPKTDDACEMNGDVPKIIHQVCFSKEPPTRWIDTWKDRFCGANSEWTHRLWTYEDLRNEKDGFFCSHLYPEEHRHMDEQTLRMLMLEILYKHGGYYVPLSSVYDESELDADNAGESIFPPAQKKNGALTATSGGIVGSIKNGLACMKLIKATYELGKMPKIHITAGCTEVKPMDIPDSTTAYLAYPSGSRYLGVSKVIVSTKNKEKPADLASTIVYAYDGQVPIRICNDSVTGSDNEVLAAVIENGEASAVVLTDSDTAKYPRVMDSIAGLIYQTEQQTDKNWDYLTLSIQWNTGHSDEVVAPVNGSFLREDLHCFGVVVNQGNNCADEFLVDTEDGDTNDTNNIIARTLRMHGEKRVYSGTVRFTHDRSMSALYSSMPVVADVFHQIAGHSIPPWEAAEEREMHGRLMKGTRNGGQLAFELNVDDNNNIFYRAFNDDGGLNCEIRIKHGLSGRHTVEHARVYYDHTIVYEGSQVRL